MSNFDELQVKKTSNVLEFLQNLKLVSTTFFFFFNVFLFKIFFTKHENIIKSNNKKNNYINQLLRLPLFKYTHTEKNNTYD